MQAQENCFSDLPEKQEVLNIQSSNLVSPLSAKSLNIYNSAKHMQSTDSHLEQENLALKTQVEMLKTVLLGICQQQQIQHPLLVLLETGSHNKQNFEQICNINEKSPQRNSPKKQKIIDNQENSIPMEVKQASIEKSKSPFRRKRSDRMGSVSPVKCEKPIIQKGRQNSKELPLQIKDKNKIFKYAVNSEERLLANDKSNIEMEQTINLFNGQTDCNELDERQDSSQIHLKYAKMLEELEQQSNSYLPSSPTTQDDNQSMREINFNKDKNQDQYTNSQNKTFHQKCKKSSQFEQKQFYEQELSILKNELEQFAKEEEQILSLLVSQKENYENDLNNSAKSNNNIVSFSISPKKIEDQQNMFQQSPEINFLQLPQSQNQYDSNNESFTSMSAKVVREISFEKSSPNHQEMLNNLQEINDFLKESQQSSEDSFIKPVKIESPLKLSQELNFDYDTNQFYQQQENIDSPVNEYNFSSEKQTPLKLSEHKISTTSSIQKQTQKSNRKRESFKNSSQFSIFNVYQTMEHSASPYKHLISSGSKKQETIDQLAKNHAKAQGLQQQEEPYEDSIDQDCLKNPQIMKTSLNKPQEDLNQSQDLFYTGQYYGLYSKEKSEEMKNQRNESIKKAEELLSQYIENQQNCRPGFLTQYISKKEDKINQEETNDKKNDIIYEISKEEQNIENESFQEESIQDYLQQKIINLNEVSFQDKEVAATYLPKFSYKDVEQSLLLNTSQSLVNIEVPISMNEFQAQQMDLIQSPRSNPQILSSFQQYKSKQQLNSMSKSLANLQTSKHQTIVQPINVNKYPLNEKIEYKCNNAIQKRKSLGNEYNKHHALIVATYYKANCKTRLDHQNTFDQQSSLNQSQKHSPFKKLQSKEQNQMCSTQQIVKKQEIEDHYCFNNTNYIDAELLYEKRSKSVIKRREEILKKKEQENRVKIEAKYQRIDQIRSSRNQRLSSQKSGNLNKSRLLSKGIDHSDNMSQLSLEEPPYQSNIELMKHQEFNYPLSSAQRQSLPTTQAFVATYSTKNLKSYQNTECKPSLLPSECSTQRKKDSEAKSRERPCCKTPLGDNNQKKNTKSLNTNIANRTNRIGIKQTNDINIRQSITINKTIHSTQQTSQSFISKDGNASKYQNSNSKNNSKCKTNVKFGMIASRSTIKLQQTLTQGMNEEVKEQKQILEGTCENCERLKSKGISTDFCLQH